MVIHFQRPQTVPESVCSPLLSPHFSFLLPFHRKLGTRVLWICVSSPPRGHGFLQAPHLPWIWPSPPLLLPLIGPCISLLSGANFSKNTNPTLIISILPKSIQGLILDSGDGARTLWSSCLPFPVTQELPASSCALLSSDAALSFGGTHHQPVPLDL